MSILHFKFELDEANMDKKGSILLDKGPGQQVDIPHQLLLFLALHIENSVGQNGKKDPSRFVCQSIKFKPAVIKLGRQGRAMKSTETGSHFWDQHLLICMNAPFYTFKFLSSASKSLFAMLSFKIMQIWGIARVTIPRVWESLECWIDFPTVTGIGSSTHTNN